MYLFQWLLDFLLLLVNETLAKGEKRMNLLHSLTAEQKRNTRIGNLRIIKYIIIFSLFRFAEKANQQRRKNQAAVSREPYN